MDKWDNQVLHEKMIDNFIDENGLLLFFTKGKDCFGAPEQSRLVFAKLKDDDLTRIANHPWFDDKEVGWYLKLMYRHNTMHRMDIRKSFKRGAPLPHTNEQRSGRNIDPQN